MKKIKLLVLIILVINTCAFSQWTQTGGPNGGYTDEIEKVGSSLIVSAGNGGIYKSIDNGESWSISNSGLPDNASVQTLFEDSDSLYASISQGGLFLSANGGDSWTSINNGIENLTFYHIGVDKKNIYAGNANGGIYYSGDNGVTWTEKSQGVSGIQFQDFSFFKSAVYAGGSSLYKTTNNGDTWEEVEVVDLGSNGVRSMTATETTLYLGDDGNVFTSTDGTSWVKSTLNVSATIVSMGSSADSVYLTTSSGRFYYTKNEGANWTLVQNTETSNYANDIMLLDDKMIMSTSEGLYTSFDGGITWTDSNSGINTLQIESMAGNSTLLLAGTASQGIFRTEDGNNWTKVNTGLDASNAKTVHDIIMLETEIILGTGGGVYLSSNSGDEWIRMFDPGINKSVQALDFDAGTFAAGVNGVGIYISKDTTKTFTLTETEGLITDTSYESIEIKGDTIAVSTAGGELFVSKDLGQTWADISIVGDYYLTYDLHFANDKLYAATSKGLLISEDLGVNWAFINNEQKVITSIALVDNMVYAATSAGFYATTENRDVWYDASGLLGHQYLNDIILVDDKIYAGTYASSVWEISISEVKLPPLILDAEPIISPEDISFTISIDQLTLEDNNTPPEDLNVVVMSGNNYSFENNTITPDENFNGNLTVPVLINNGIIDSPIYDISVEIRPVNDAPVIIGQQNSLTTAQETEITIQLSDLMVQDVDSNFPSDFSMTINEGSNYSFTGNTVIPNEGFSGELSVPVIVNDGDLDSEEFIVLIGVTENEILSVENDFIRKNFAIYPNPIQNELHVNLNSPLRSYQLKVYDSVGNLIYSIAKSDNDLNSNIDFKSMPSGMYSIKIISEDGIGTAKVIKR